jgi:hypothetical protein
VAIEKAAGGNSGEEAMIKPPRTQAFWALTLKGTEKVARRQELARFCTDLDTGSCLAVKRP